MNACFLQGSIDKNQDVVSISRNPYKKQSILYSIVLYQYGLVSRELVLDKKQAIIRWTNGNCFFSYFAF